jgi:hypothetical protein
MPWLDSLAGKLDKDVGYFFVSEMSDASADSCIKRNNYKIKNFVFLNNMNEFVEALCRENKIKTLTYPTLLILNDKGELLLNTVGAYSNKREAAGFIELINSLD